MKSKKLVSKLSVLTVLLNLLMAQSIVDAADTPTTLGTTITSDTYKSTVETFSDVPITHWGYVAIKWGVDNSVINGYPDGTFKPAQNVSQSEFLAMLIRTYAIELPNLSDNQPLDAYLKYAQDNNWSLMDDSNMPITRGQIAKLLTNASGKNFNMRDAVHYLLDTGLSNGKTDRSIDGYEANDLMTRAEAITFIKNVKTKLNKLEPAPTMEQKYNNPNSDIQDNVKRSGSENSGQFLPDPEHRKFADAFFKTLVLSEDGNNLKFTFPDKIDDGENKAQGTLYNLEDKSLEEGSSYTINLSTDFVVGVGYGLTKMTEEGYLICSSNTEKPFMKKLLMDVPKDKGIIVFSIRTQKWYTLDSFLKGLNIKK